ncbi:MAG TPA: hypothetical protein VLT36_01095 [Candidatus Dormibacteraeota bacterium]|nr:hypothetical protein [Candidatus Dormibacteraeota bacterium]
MAHTKLAVLSYCLLPAALVGARSLCAQEGVDTRGAIEALKQQNEALQQQLREQKSLIDSLNARMNSVQEARAERSKDMADLHKQMEQATEGAKPAPSSTPGKVIISGEGGAGYFQTGSEGMFPKGDFRLDEAKLFLETPIWNEVYFFGEINLRTREMSDVTVRLGEAYIDFEDVSKLWNQERILNIRLGRMDIPFGEEYIYRDAIDNPLITHSLSDIWGIDEGVEVYGSIRQFSYAVAVQNGGSSYRDFESDKSVAGRLSLDPATWLHFSVSGMRTGNLKQPDDLWSALYFGNGWFVPLDPAHTTKFHAEIAEGDLELKFPHGYLKAFGGYAHYNDNDATADNGRDIYYYAVEGKYDLCRKLYAAARFSEVFADDGYPISGNGDMGQYLFSGVLTKELWRLSLGLGYRFSDNLLFKGEYSFERGKQIGGESRDHEDLFAVMAAYRF